MEKFILQNYLYGAETPIKQKGFKILEAEKIENILDENGNLLETIVTPAVYSDKVLYDTGISLPEIPEGDVAYFVTVTLYIKSNTDLFSDFQHILRIVSLNSQTGFEVDAQREQVIQDYIIKINL
jgi:hypothetical protein